MLRLMNLHKHVNEESMKKVIALKYVSGILGVRVPMDTARYIYHCTSWQWENLLI